MRVYISGPISMGGTLPPEEWGANIARFGEAAAALRALGHEAISPCEGEPEDLDWSGYMRRDIHMLVDCDGLAYLPGWDTSRGARLEHHIAAELGFWIGPVDDLLANAAAESGDALPPDKETETASRGCRG